MLYSSLSTSQSTTRRKLSLLLLLLNKLLLDHKLLLAKLSLSLCELADALLEVAIA